MTIGIIDVDRTHFPNIALGKQIETISQEDIEKAAEAFATPPIGNGGMFTREQVKELLVRFAQLLLSKQEKDAEDTVIQGWVCRDKEWDKVLFASDLYLSAKKPKRDEYCGAWCNMVSYMPLKTELFPNLTWDDDPIEVEIIIKRKKK